MELAEHSLQSLTSPPPKVYVDEQRASKITGVRRGTLRRWRADGYGPPFRKFRALVRYPLAGLYDWIESQPLGGGN
jgi:hypothetical protein